MSEVMDGTDGIIEPTKKPARLGETNESGTSGDGQDVQRADGGSPDSKDQPMESPSTDQTARRTPRPYTRKVSPEPKQRESDRTGPDGSDGIKTASSKPVRATTYRETAKERKRRDPLRKELADLVDREKGLIQDLERTRDSIAIATMRLEPLPGETTRICFGNFDLSDWDCRSICPLRPECEVTTEKRRPGADREGATA